MAEEKTIVNQIMDHLADSTKGVTIPEKPIKQPKSEKPEYAPPKNYGGAEVPLKNPKTFNNNFDGNRNNCNNQ